MSGLWGQDKPEQKRAGGEGEAWLRSPRGYAVVRMASAGETLHAKWVSVTDAEVGDDGRLRIGPARRMLHFNAAQLWRNLIRAGWTRVPPQW